MSAEDRATPAEISGASGPYVVTWLNQFGQTQWLALDAAGLTAFSEWHSEFTVATSETLSLEEFAKRIGL